MHPHFQDISIETISRSWNKVNSSSSPILNVSIDGFPVKGILGSILMAVCVSAANNPGIAGIGEMICDSAEMVIFVRPG